MALTAKTPAKRSGTADLILNSAEELVQRRGFNGFSYADISAELGMRKASLHYHFAGKTDLGEALIRRYTQHFAAALEAIDARTDDPRTKLEWYAALYADVLQRKRMCLCGILAAEYETLPEGMQRAVIAFFDENERWLEGVLEDGRRRGFLGFPGSSRESARTIIAGLEGAMLVARPYGDVARFQASAAQLLAGLVA